MLVELPLDTSATMRRSLSLKFCPSLLIESSLVGSTDILFDLIDIPEFAERDSPTPASLAIKPLFVFNCKLPRKF